MALSPGSSGPAAYPPNRDSPLPMPHTAFGGTLGVMNYKIFKILSRGG